MIKSHYDEILFFIKIQWLERKVTSTYIIGMTVQLLLFIFSIYNSKLSDIDIFIYSIKLSVFLSLNILILSCMSNITNEYKFETIKFIISSPLGLKRIILYRNIGNLIIISPAFIILTLIGYEKSNIVTFREFLLVIFFVFFVLSLYCNIITALINLYHKPSMAVPWVKYVFIFIGLGLIPLPIFNNLYEYLPINIAITISTSKYLEFNNIAIFISEVIGMVLISNLIWSRILIPNIQQHLNSEKMKYI